MGSCAADKQTFASLDVVGWYSTGSKLEESDMTLHRKVEAPSELLRTGRTDGGICALDGKTCRPRYG